MLKKEEIIKELKNEEFIVRNAVYEYVCNLHLYDDTEINKAFTAFLQKNYNLEINYSYLLYSKLNRKIIECLIQLYFNEKDISAKENIETVLIMHYELIKDLDYKFEDIFTDEDNILLYKKIKHFSNKNPEDLFEMYLKKSEERLYNEEAHTYQILIEAMENAIIQTKKGQEVLLEYIKNIIVDKNESVKDMINLVNTARLPRYLYPLCKLANPLYAYDVLKLYFLDMDYYVDINVLFNYFSNICNKEFVLKYIEFLDYKYKGENEDFDYDIAEYLNSEEMDNYLLDSLKKCKDKQIKLNIMRILANKFDNRIVDYALNSVKHDNYYKDDELTLALAPLLILENRNDEISSEIIENAKTFFDEEEIVEYEDEENDDDDDEYEYEEDDLASQIYKSLFGIRDLLLKNKPHIKAYKKARKIHGEIIDSMMYYAETPKYREVTKKQYSEITQNNENNLKMIDTFFDTRTQLGMQALANVMIYKNFEKMDCITEEYLKTNKFRKKEKVDFLKAMLESKAGLYEIIKTNAMEAQVYLKNVLTEEEICITDIAMSGNIDNSGHYLYTRIISYNNINFGTGLSMIFAKKDQFIQKWIQENKKDYDEKKELMRFIELYNRYKDDKNRIEARMNRF